MDIRIIDSGKGVLEIIYAIIFYIGMTFMLLVNSEYYILQDRVAMKLTSLLLAFFIPVLFIIHQYKFMKPALLIRLMASFLLLLFCLHVSFNYERACFNTSSATELFLFFGVLWSVFSGARYFFCLKKEFGFLGTVSNFFDIGYAFKNVNKKNIKLSPFLLSVLFPISNLILMPFLVHKGGEAFFWLIFIFCLSLIILPFHYFTRTSVDFLYVEVVCRLFPVLL